MSVTTFIYKQRVVGSAEIPNHALRLRRKCAYFCLWCGDIYARILPSDPFFDYWDVEHHPCPTHQEKQEGGNFLFFNDHELTAGRPSALELLPREVLALETIIRSERYRL
jgi:hypothetical protein